MCVHVYIHIYCVYIYICERECVRVSVCVWVCVGYTYSNMCVYSLYIYNYIYICWECVYMCVLCELCDNQNHHTYTIGTRRLTQSTATDPAGPCTLWSPLGVLLLLWADPGTYRTKKRFILHRFCFGCQLFGETWLFKWSSNFSKYRIQQQGHWISPFCNVLCWILIFSYKVASSWPNMLYGEFTTNWAMKYILSLSIPLSGWFLDNPCQTMVQPTFRDV